MQQIECLTIVYRDNRVVRTFDPELYEITETYETFEVVKKVEREERDKRAKTVIRVIPKRSLREWTKTIYD